MSDCIDAQSFIKKVLLNDTETKFLAARTSKKWILNHGYENEYVNILQLTSFLPSDSLFRNRLYCILNNIFEPIKCKNCGKETSFGKISFNIFCSKKCAAIFNGIAGSSKTKNTKLQRYGNSKYNNIEKMRQTKKIKYGNEYYTNSEKAIKTKIKNNTTLKNPKILLKSKATKLDRYGDEPHLDVVVKQAS